MGRWEDEQRWGGPQGSAPHRDDEREPWAREGFGRRASDREQVRDTGRGGEYERRPEPSRSWRERTARGEGRPGRDWRGGDYTTYGLSGYSQEDLRAAHQDFVREQGRGVHQHERGRDRFDRPGAWSEMRAGRGPKGYRRSDEAIRDEVCERIARSWVDAGDVEVHIDGGEVTLSGEVETRYEKRLLEDLADEVFGVEDVHNRIRLRHARREDEGARQGEERPEHHHEAHTDPSAHH